MLAFILAAALVASPAPSPTSSPGMTIALPPPTHGCKAVVDMAKVRGKKFNADTLGQMYAGALKLNGVVGTERISAQQLIVAYSDFIYCFVPGGPAKR